MYEKWDCIKGLRVKSMKFEIIDSVVLAQFTKGLTPNLSVLWSFAKILKLASFLKWILEWKNLKSLSEMWLLLFKFNSIMTI